MFVLLGFLWTLELQTDPELGEDFVVILRGFGGC